MDEIKKAIELLKRSTLIDWEFTTEEHDKALKLAITALEAQQVDGWIPIKGSEELPETNGFYIFQTKGNKIHEWWFEDGKIYVDNIHDEEYLFKANDMKAWMLLPEPYKEEHHG